MHVAYVLNFASMEFIIMMKKIYPLLSNLKTVLKVAGVVRTNVPRGR